MVTGKACTLRSVVKQADVLHGEQGVPVGGAADGIMQDVYSPLGMGGMLRI